MPDFLKNEITLTLLSTLLALTPALIWLKIWRSRQQEKNKRSLVKIFILGFLSILPVIGFQIISTCSPDTLGASNLHLPCLPSGWNPLLFIQTHAHDPTIKSALFFAFFAALEEIGKLGIVKYADFNGKKINTINDSIMFSLVAALSFAFVENIVYFHNILIAGSVATLFSVFVFRSVFTAAAHAIFSGIAGYHYGLGKFAKPIVETARWKGQLPGFAGLIHRLLGVPPSATLGAQLKIKGLLIAILAHATFNFLLERNEILWVSILVAIGVLYMFHLIQRKSGALYLRLTDARPSTMSPRDEDVVLELIGMWINQGKYDEVMEICERLLKRDPDNNVVKLFLAEAHHEKELKAAYKAIKALFTHEEEKEQPNHLKKKV